MSGKRYDVVGVGNAIVDVLAQVPEEFITAMEMEKGGMMMIDEARAHAIYDKFPPAIEMSGGSAANTLAGVASLGANGAYIGKVADDQLGEVFKHDMTAGGVHYDTNPLVGGAATATCLIAVTPDGERTMNTFLGASSMFSEEDVDEALIAQGQIVYLEGYLYDKPEAKAAFDRAAAAAAKAGAQVAITLSDTFCVDRHRDDFIRFIDERADIVFANEAEAKALAQTDDFDEAAAFLNGRAFITAITRSEKGSTITRNGEQAHVGAQPVLKVVDTTGAGDLYAAGVLTGLAKGLSLEDAGKLGAIAASEIISHMGPRPQGSLKDLAAAEGVKV